MRPNILSRHTILASPSSHHWHVRWEPSPVTCLRVISKWLNTFKKWPWFLPLTPRCSVVSRTAYQGSFTMSQWSQSRRSMIHDVMSSQLGSSRESNHVFCRPYFCIFLAIIIQWGLFIIRIDLFKIRPDSAQRSARRSLTLKDYSSSIFWALHHLKSTCNGELRLIKISFRSVNHFGSWTRIAGQQKQLAVLAEL